MIRCGGGLLYDAGLKTKHFAVFSGPGIHFFILRIKRGGFL